MNRISQWMASGVLGVLAIGASATAAAAAATAGTGAELTVQQILERHAAAVGGPTAWRKIKTMAWTGHIESGPGGATQRPFMMMFRRPEAMRFEIIADGQRTARIFDGRGGWKLRASSSGMPEVSDYTPEDLAFAHDAGGIDGPLVDAKSKGIDVALVGLDSVEGHRAYRLRVNFPSGHVQEAWIDARSFLELRYDRATRSTRGASGTVSVYLRNYQTVEGLKIPSLIETGSPVARDTDKMIIEKIALNPALEERQFSKPMVPGRRQRGAVIDIAPPAGAPPGR